MALKTRPRTPSLELLFARYRESGDPVPLGALFDATAPGLFRLALSLTSDAASAEDAVQETFLSAMKYRDHWDADRPVLPWLTGILRRKVVDARRRVGRAPDPMRVVPPVLRPDPAGTAEHNEDLERVRRGLASLPEPYRTVGILRWRHGLAPAEIAELRGEPPGTVRSILSRAVARLRKDLRALPVLLLLRGGRPERGLGAVREELLRKAAGRAGAATVGAGGLAVLIGGVLVAKKAAAGIVIALALLAFLALRTGDTKSGDPQGVSGPGKGNSVAAVSPPAMKTAAEAPVPAEAPAGDPAVPPISGRVVDREGKAVPGARVFSIPDDTDEAVVDLGQAGKAGRRTRAAPTGADGSFTVTLDPLTILCTVLADAPGFARAERKDIRPGTCGITLVLDRCTVLFGKVLSEEGSPVAGAVVRVHGFAYESGAGFDLSTKSGEDGAYRLEGVPPHRLNNLNHQQLWMEVRAKGFAVLQISGRNYFERGLPDFAPGKEIRQDLYLSPGITLVGRVIDARTREPVPGAIVIAVTTTGTAMRQRTTQDGGQVFESGEFSREGDETEVRSGSDGRFAFTHAPCRGFHRSSGQDQGNSAGLVVAWKEGWSTGITGITLGNPGDTLEVQILLSPAATLEGRVVDEAGKPIPGAFIQASTGDPLREGWLKAFLWGLRDYPSNNATSDVDGRYRMTGVVLREAGVATIRICGQRPRPAERFIWGSDGEVSVEGSPGAVSRAPDLVLRERAMAAVRFLVKDESGNPVRGAYFRPGQRRTKGPNVEYASARTGPDGRGRLFFDWGEMESEQISVDISAPGYAFARVYATPSIDEQEEVLVVLRKGLRLSGHVLRADGSPASNASVTVTTGNAAVEDVFPPDEIRAARTTDSARYVFGYARVEEDGWFHAEDLPEGPYMVCAEAIREHGRPADSNFVRTIARSVPTAAPDLVITLPPDEVPAGARLECAVTDAVTGRPVGRFGATLYGEGGRRVDGAQIAPGRCAFEGVPPGTWDISVAAYDYCPALQKGVEVREGAPSSVPAVALERGATVHGILRLAGGTPVTFATLAFTPGPESSPLAHPVNVPLNSSTGICRIGGFRPGRYRLEVRSTSFGQPNLAPANGEVLTIPEGTADVTFDLVVCPVGTLDVYARDPKLPKPAGSGPEAVEEKVRFGQACRLVVLNSTGIVVAEKKGVERGEYVPSLTCSLPEGTYRVRLEMPAGESAEETIAVSATERKSLVVGGK